MARPKKIQLFKLKPYTNSAGSSSWRITGTKRDGIRVRQNFADKGEAILKLAELESEEEGQVAAIRAQRTRMSPQEVADAESAVLAADGRRVSPIVAAYLSLEARAKAKGMDLDMAVAFAEAHYRHEIQGITILNAHRQFVDSRMTDSPKTKEHYEYGVGLLLKPDPNKELHCFTLGDIEKILVKYKNVNSRKTYQRAFTTFFNWAVRHHHCLENPCARLDKLPRDMTKITILELEESRRLLYATLLLQEGAAAAYVAIGLFAGLRPSEIRDLKPEDIRKDSIRVSGGKLRRQLKRSVPIPPALAAWLKEFPFTRLPPGLDGKMKRLKKATRAKIWVQDVIRHTSISFQTERDKNEALTAYNCGTSKIMMDLHYRQSVDDENTVAEFWSLTPAKLRAEPPEVNLETKRRVDWPETKTLRKLVWEKPLVHAASGLGVSDVALRKRCIKLGVALPPRGHWLR